MHSKKKGILPNLKKSFVDVEKLPNVANVSKKE